MMSSVMGFSMSSPAGLCLSFISRQGIEAAAGSQSFKILGFFFCFFFLMNMVQKSRWRKSLSHPFPQSPSFHHSATSPPGSLPPSRCSVHIAFRFFFFSFVFPFLTQMEDHYTNCSATCFCHLSILEIAPEPSIKFTLLLAAQYFMVM